MEESKRDISVTDLAAMTEKLQLQKAKKAKRDASDVPMIAVRSKNIKKVKNSEKSKKGEHKHQFNAHQRLRREPGSRKK